jgi:hypothetical protein
VYNYSHVSLFVYNGVFCVTTVYLLKLRPGNINIA